MKPAKSVVLIPCHGMEDFPTHFTGREAQQLLAAYTGVWHPGMIYQFQQMPAFFSTDFLNEELKNAIVVIPETSTHRISPEIQEQIDQNDCVAVSDFETRSQLFEDEHIRSVIDSSSIPDSVVADFLALGYGYLQIQLITRQLRYSTNLDETEFENRLVAAATSAHKCEDSVTEKLQACFDLLLEERNRYYPVIPQLLDVVMVAESTLGSRMESQLQSSHPINVLLDGTTCSTIVARKPDLKSRLTSRIAQKSLELIGGLSHEIPATVASQESQLRQLVVGSRQFEDLSDSPPALFARRSFGFNPSLPNLLTNLNYGGALHAKFDQGQYPSASSSCIKWQGTGGETINAIFRDPIDASLPDGFLNLAISIGEELDSAHHATVVFAHWPGRTCDSFSDLVNLTKYGPLLGNFVVAHDYLDTFYDPGYTENYTADEYRSPILKQWCSRSLANPISRVVKYWQAHYRTVALNSTLIASELWRPQPVQSSSRAQPEKCLAEELQTEIAELGIRLDQCLMENQSQSESQSELANEILDELTRTEQTIANRVQDRIQQSSNGESAESLVVFNSCSFARRVHLELEDFATGSLKEPNDSAIHLADTGSHQSDVLVDVPAFGCAVIDRRHTSQSGQPFKKDPPVLDGNILRNEFFELQIDPKTGGIRTVHKHLQRGNLMTQRLSLRIPGETDSYGNPITNPRYCEMVADSIRGTTSSKIAAHIESIGRIVDVTNDQRTDVATFRQRVSVVRGRRIFDVGIEIDPSVELAKTPWLNYFCSRVAWNDEAADIIREQHGTQHAVTEDRFESPKFVELFENDTKISLLPRGLAFHRRSSRRMLDTLLIVAGETEQQFNLSVGIDVPVSAQAAVDCSTPVQKWRHDHETSHLSGWIFHINCKNVLASNVEPRFDGNDRLVGVAFRLQETEGRAGRLTITCPRKLVSGRRVNFCHERIRDAELDGNRASFNFLSNDFFQIELHW